MQDGKQRPAPGSWNDTAYLEVTHCFKNNEKGAGRKQQEEGMPGRTGVAAVSGEKGSALPGARESRQDLVPSPT